MVMFGTVSSSCSSNDEDDESLLDYYDFEVDGFYFDIVSLGEATCMISARQNNQHSKGNVTIPATVNYGGRELKVVEIGGWLFRDCPDLTGIAIPNTVTRIEEYAFADCTHLMDVVIPSSMTYIGFAAFQNCASLVNVTLPDGMTELGNWMFSGCASLMNVTLPNGVTELGNAMFEGCVSLKTISIPNSVTTLGVNLFKGCTGLTNVTLGNSVTMIKHEAFATCNSLTTLYSLNLTPPSIDGYCFTNNHYMTLNVFVPKEALAAYQNADGWKDFWHLQGI